MGVALMWVCACCESMYAWRSVDIAYQSGAYMGTDMEVMDGVEEGFSYVGM